jgi:hypothetical protein
MNEYKHRTYEELSQEFRKIYPTLTRAYELVALMYNLLTANGFPHKEAITKIRDDHKDLPGFSTRNIYRCLPRDNPYIPRRVVPPRHKNSITETSGELDLSNTKDEQDNKIELSGEGYNISAYVSEQIYHGKKSPTLEKISGVEAVDENGRKMHEYTSTSRVHNKDDLVDFEFSLPVEDVRRYMASIYDQNKGIGHVCFHGSLDIRTGKVTRAATGSAITDDSAHVDNASQIEWLLKVLENKI